MGFTGQIAELPIGMQGLTGNKNQSQISEQQLIIANNLTYEDGTLRKEGGTAKYNSNAISATPSILQGIDWNHDGSTQRMVVFTSNGKLLKDSGDGTFPVTLKSSLTVSGATSPIFVQGGKEVAANNQKLFIFSAANVVQVLSADGATTSNLATPPVDWSGGDQPVCATAHEGRIWGGGNPNDPHRAYYSRTTDHEDWTGDGSGTISIYPGDGGGGIVGMFSFKGLLVVFKSPRGIYAVDTTNPTVANWKVSQISTTIGAAAVGTMAHMDEDIAFIDEAGTLWLVSSVQVFGNIGARSLGDISDINTFIRDNLNLSNKGTWRMINYPHKRELHIACTGLGATTNNQRLVIDVEAGQPRLRSSDRDTAVSLWLREESGTPRLMFGDDAGFVYKMDQDARSDAGAGYAGEFQSAHNDLAFMDPSLASIDKSGCFLELVVEPKGNWNLSVDMNWDTVLQETLQFNMGTAGATLGTFVLGTDVLAGSAILNKKKRITGGGRRLSIKGSNSGDAQDFSVAKFLLYFTRSDDGVP